MSTLNPTKKISRRQELRKDTVVTFYARVWQFFDQNRKLVYGILAGVAVVIVALIGNAFYNNARQSEALAKMAGAVQAYEQGNYREALDGTADFVGLLAIIDDYGSTDAGNLARFYAADALFRLGEYDEALKYFKEFDKPDNIIGASAVAGEAAVYEHKGEYKRAGDLYRKAAEMVDTDLISAQYLLDAARSYEAAGDYRRARDAYEEIRERYPDAPAARKVDMYLARLDALEEAAS